jgi:hypothetical protein
MSKLLCFLGSHRWKFSATFLPSISAEIVTDYITYCQCERCGKVISHCHVVWDGENMVYKT